MKSKTNHQTFVLRLWQIAREKQLAMLITLDDCQTGQRKTFASPTDLMEFLEKYGQVERPPAPTELYPRNSE